MPNTDPDRSRTLPVDLDMENHGVQGPVQVSYPSFIYNQSGIHDTRICLFYN